jgi:hypothetical protein
VAFQLLRQAIGAAQRGHELAGDLAVFRALMDMRLEVREELHPPARRRIVLGQKFLLGGLADENLLADA